MALTIEELNIQIEASASNASKNLDDLVVSLEKLKSATSKATNLSSIVKGINNLASASSSLNSINYGQFGKNIESLSKALKPLNEIKGQIGATINALTKLKSIEEQLNEDGFMDKFKTGIVNLQDALSSLSSVGSTVGNTLNALRKIGEVANSLDAIFANDTFKNNLTSLSTALGSFATISKGGLTGLINQLKNNLPELQRVFNTLDMDKVVGNLNKLSVAFVHFGDIKKNSLASLINNLKKLPELSKELAAMDIDKFAAQMERLATAMAPLAEKCNQISAGFARLPQRTEQVMSAFDSLENKTQKVSKSYSSMMSTLTKGIARFSILYYAAKRVAGVFADWFNESNSYIETLNLFNVTMGEGAEEAYNYAEKVQSLMGIDISEWMQYQGTFQNLATGFGMASDQANQMSKNLTQLSYDLASFFNTSTEEASDKLASAMSGQVKGLREYGIETSIAALQEYALSKGITQSVRSMTMAQKTLLRYNLIMEKSIIMQGDMARTIITPANALRVLNAQLTQMKRALGNIVSVLIAKLIPYIQAFVQLITQAASAIASFFGFTLPEIDYSGLSTAFADDMEDASDSVESVGSGLKEIRKQLMGFDELNIISKPSSSSSGSGSSGTGVGGGSFDMPLYDYDFLQNLEESGTITKIKEQVLGLLEKLQPTIDALKHLWDAFVPFASKVGEGLIEFLGDFIYSAAEFENNFVAPVIDAIAAALDNVDPEKAKELGYSLGQLAEALLLYKGLMWVGGVFAKIGTGITSLGAGLQGLISGGGLNGLVAALAPLVDVIYHGILDSLDSGLAKRIEQAIAGFVGGGLAGAAIGVIGGPIGMGIGALVGAIVGCFWDEFKNCFLSIFNWDTTMEIFNEAIDYFKKAFSSDNMFDIGNNIILGIIDGFLGGIAMFLEPIQNLFDYIWDCICGIFGIHSPAREMKPLGENVLLGLVEGFVGAFSSMWDAIKKWGSETFAKIKESFSLKNIKQHFIDVYEGIKEVFSSIPDWFKNKFSEAWTKVKEVFSPGGEIFSGIKEGIASTFKTIVNKLISGINTIIAIPFNKINSMLNKIREASFLGISPFKNLWSQNPLSVPKIPTLATGGLLDAGQMFIAREAGPELVGKIGSKNAVVNNEQIIQGITSGVARGVAMAMQGNGNNGGDINITTKVYVKEKEIGEAALKYIKGQSRATGKSYF